MTASRSLLVVAAAVLGHLGVAIGASQVPIDPAFSGELKTWVTAVEQHVPGRADAAVTAVAHWPGGQLRAVLSELKRKEKREFNLFFIRAAVLHADIAILNHHAGGYSLPPDGPEFRVSSDGSAIGHGRGTFHWEFGRLLLDSVLPSPSKNTRVRVWYRATVAIMQSWGDFSELTIHLPRARQLFPDDPIILLYAGAIHESYATPRIQAVIEPAGSDTQPIALPNQSGNAFSATISSASGSGVTFRIGTTVAELSQAGELFRQAIRLDPELSEARIRRAQVLGALGQHREAAAEIQRALGGRLRADFEYYARLFLGRAQQALGQFDLARAAFERATVLFPEAQSPRLALSQLAFDRGDRTEAVAGLSVLARTTAGVDPWWDYRRSHEPSVDEWLVELRRGSSSSPK